MHAEHIALAPNHDEWEDEREQHKRGEDAEKRIDRAGEEEREAEDDAEKAEEEEGHLVNASSKKFRSSATSFRPKIISPEYRFPFSG